MSSTTNNNFTLTESDLTHLRADPSKFQAKAWLSSCWNQIMTNQQQQQDENTTSNNNSNNNNNSSSSSASSLSKINLALQLQAQECTSTLDDIAAQVLSRVPRSLVEIERCENEVCTLREKLQQKNVLQGSTGIAHEEQVENGEDQPPAAVANKAQQVQTQVVNATSKIKSMQVARQRLQHCKNVLAEWNNLAKRSDEVEKKVEQFLSSSSSSSSAFSQIATDIAGLRKSIALIEKVEPSVIKQANARVSAIETRIQNFAESEVLAALSKALSSSSSSSVNSSASSPQQEEAVQAIITIGKLPELLEKSFVTLGESRRAKYLQELEKASSSSSSSTDSSSTLIRKIYHSIITKALQQDFDNVYRLLVTQHHSSSSSSADEGDKAIQTTIRNHARMSALLVVDNSKFKSLVSSLLNDKMKVDEALSCGSKVLSEFSSVVSQNKSSEKLTTKDDSFDKPTEKLFVAIKSPFTDSLSKLESFEKTFIFSKMPSSSSSSSWSDQLDVFAKLSGAIVTSASRVCRDWTSLVPSQTAEKVSKTIWSAALIEWSENFVNATKKEITSSEKSSSQPEATLKLLLEIYDASKSLPERATNLENVLTQQQQQQQQDDSSSSADPSTTSPSSSSSPSLKLIQEGLTAVKKVEERVKYIFLDQLLRPAFALLEIFVQESDYLKKKNPNKDSSNNNSSSSSKSPTSNNSNNNNNTMPSEAIRSLGAWLMELPMLLETIGADTAKWTSVAVERLVDVFVVKVNENVPNSTSNNSDHSSENNKMQLKIDCEYFENVLQAVDDSLDIHSKLKI